MLISNKIHYFRNFGVQRYNKSVKIYNDILFYKSKCNGFHLRLLLLYP